jgi:hypothetical protein
MRLKTPCLHCIAEPEENGSIGFISVFLRIYVKEPILMLVSQVKVGSIGIVQWQLPPKQASIALAVG